MSQHAALVDPSKMSSCHESEWEKRKPFLIPPPVYYLSCRLIKCYFPNVRQFIGRIKRVRQFVTVSADAYIDNQNALFKQLAPFRVLLNRVVFVLRWERISSIFFSISKRIARTHY